MLQCNYILYVFVYSTLSLLESNTMLGDLLLSQPSQVLPLFDTALKSAARAVYNAASAAEKIHLVNKHAISKM